MSRLLTFLLLLFSFTSYSQCDLELLNFDPIVGEITVAFNNTESCGGSAGPTGIAEIQFGFQALDSNCNALNQGWDFPWGLSIPGDNNHPGWIYSATTTVQSSNWTNLDVWADYNVDPPYYTGDTITFPLDDFYQANSNSLYSNLLNAFEFWMNQGFGIQAVIWQISYGPTMYADNGGWAEVGGLGGGITPPCCGLYEDSNWQDNWLITCPDDIPEVIYVYDTVYVDLPPDTVVEYVYDTTYVTLLDTIVEYDTIPVAINWYFYDTTYIYVELPPDTITVTEIHTLYVELPPDTITVTEIDTLYVELPPDTIVETIYDTLYWFYEDTLYITLPPDTVTITETEFIFVTDTIFETDIVYITDSLYITLIDTIIEYQFIEIDCSTGLPCSDLGFDECEPLTVYIPNAFTPNNDGYNDAWEVVLDPGCWTDVILQVYSRWGNLVFESYDPYYLIWDGSNMGSSYYVPDGTYYWVFSGRKVNTTIIEELEGHITIFR